MEVRPEGVLEVRGVGEAVLAEERRRLVGDLVPRRSITDGPLPGDPLQNLRALHEDLLLLVAAPSLERLVEVAVVADLVAPTIDLRDHVRVALRRPAGHEERRAEPVRL